MTATSLGPSRRWYWVSAGLLLAALACIGLAVAAFFALSGSVRDFQRGPVPGEFEVQFAEPGKYVLYLEGQGVADLSSVGARNVSLQSADGDHQVRLDHSSATTFYAFGSHEGKSVAKFTIDRPGTYVLQVGEPSSPQVTSAAVGRGIGWGVVLPVLLVLGAVFGLIPAALVVAIVTLVRRRSARRARRAAPPPGWQPDPSRRAGVRYWDGTRWVEPASGDGTAKSDPP